MAASPEPETADIRTVSELTGLSIDTLRWYERQGLLPLVERDSAGRRRYPPAAVRFIRLVRALRRTGMSVADVRDFVQMGHGLEWHDRRTALLEEHAAAIEEQIGRLHQDLALVREKIAHHRDLQRRGLGCEDELGTTPHSTPRPGRAAPRTTEGGDTHA